MTGIPKDVPINDLLSAIGEKPQVSVNKWGSVKVQFSLGGKEYKVSRNEIAKILHEKGDDNQKEKLKTIFNEIESSAQKQLGNRFKRFSHRVRSFFGKAKFDFRKAMQKWGGEGETINALGGKDDSNENVLLRKGLTTEAFLDEANKIVKRGNWDLINEYILDYRRSFFNNTEEEKKSFKAVLELAVQKDSEYRGHYFMYLIGEYDYESDGHKNCMLGALANCHPDSLYALESFFGLDATLAVEDALLDIDLKTSLEDLKKYAAPVLLAAGLECKKQFSSFKIDHIKERAILLLEAASQANSAAAAYHLATLKTSSEEREKYLMLAKDRGHELAKLISENSAAKNGFLKGLQRPDQEVLMSSESSSEEILGAARRLLSFSRYGDIKDYIWEGVSSSDSETLDSDRKAVLQKVLKLAIQKIPDYSAEGYLYLGDLAEDESEKKSYYLKALAAGQVRVAIDRLYAHQFDEIEADDFLLQMCYDDFEREEKEKAFQAFVEQKHPVALLIDAHPQAKKALFDYIYVRF